MKKRLSPQKKQQLIFKALLLALLFLLILLIWVGSSNDASSQFSDVVHGRQNISTQDGIGRAISPMLAEETFELTFEYELPDPVPTNTKPRNNDALTTDRHQLALIIDDVGYDMRAFQRLLELPLNMTISILPDSPYAAEAARMAHQHGLTVMLHMPMQTANPKYKQKMERFYLHKDMTKQAFTDVFEAALAKVPYVVGINNHMGSLLTEDSKSMLWLTELCAKHDLFFIDSRTSSASVGAKIAEETGISWNERDIFLDHSVETEKLQHAWDSAISCAKRNDHCILLAHPHKETVTFLEQQIQAINHQQFVSITDVLKGK